MIPFCEFGGSNFAVSVKIDKLSIPVCNCFKAKIVNDQLCYEVDLDRFSNKSNIKRELETGFIFIMDYNEDRQVSFDDQDNTNIVENNFASTIVESNDIEKHASISLETIGKKERCLLSYISHASILS